MVEDTSHVISVIDLLGATYGHAFGKNQVRAYVATLADIDGDLLKAAALQFIESNTYPRIPTPGELRQHAAEIVTRAQGLPPASEAWGEVSHQLRYVGSWGTPKWTTPLIAQAVADVGGWMYLCMSENAPADRARFIAAYDERLKRHNRDLMQMPASEQYGAALAERLKSAPLQRISELADSMRIGRIPAKSEAPR